MSTGFVRRRDILRSLLWWSVAGVRLRAQGKPPPAPLVLVTLQELRVQMAGAGVDRELGWLEKSIRPDAVVPPAATIALDDLRFAMTQSALMGPVRLSVQALVAEDIKVKAAYCRSHPAGMAALVRLTVRTWAHQAAGRAEQSDWQVMYISTPQTLLSDYVGRSFPQFSSPCEMDLSPGLWTIWTQHPRDGTRRGPTKEVILGAAPGAATLAADVLVP